MPRIGVNGSASSRTQVEQAPSSANSLPRPPTSIRSPAIPAPSSFKASSSLVMNRSPGMSSSGRLSPRRPLQSKVVELPTVQSDLAPQKPNRSMVKAAESGKGTLLPDFTSTLNGSRNKAGMRSREPPNRHKTRSSPSLKQVMNLGGTFKKRQQSTSSISGGELPQTQQDVGGSNFNLRRRTYSTTQSDDEDLLRSNRHHNDSPYRSYSRRGRGNLLSWQKLSRLKLGHILQVVIVIAVTALVWESHHKALFAAHQIAQYKEEESLLLLHLQKIEQFVIQLSENLGRLSESGFRAADEASDQKNGDVDFDLIHKQTQQLYQMEEDLNQEVHALQHRIQQSARNHIVTVYGEGPVQVVLDLDFGDNKDGPTRISVLLWHDTPHAAWTWLEQIGRSVWDGAAFSWEQGHIIDAIPQKADPLAGKIQFLEQSQHSHEAWTVGLRETDEGAMTMYINLQDNGNVHRHETCVGKVIDGFDALQRLLEVSRSGLHSQAPTITIRKAVAMHVTKKEH